MKNFMRFFAGAAVVSLMVLPASAAEINVGLITSMTGPGASIGIPYAKGTAAGVAYKDEVDGTKLNLIQLDDATDPSTATRNARKLIEQDKVDVLMGSGSDAELDRHYGGLSRTESSLHHAFAGQHAGRARLVDDFDSAAAEFDGVGRGRLHEDGRGQDGRLYRL